MIVSRVGVVALPSDLLRCSKSLCFVCVLGAFDVACDVCWFCLFLRA